MATAAVAQSLLANEAVRSELLTQAKTRTQKEALAVKSWITDGPLALKACCFIVCAASCAVSCLSVLGSLLNPAGLALSVWCAVLSFIGVLLEVKPLLCTRVCKRRVEFWFKAFGRLWGRALLYAMTGSMLLALGGLLRFGCAIGMFCCAVFSFAVSRAATAKLNSLHRALIREHGDKDERRIRAAFQELDADGDGSLDASELALVAGRLGAALSNDELHAVFELLDVDGSGKVDFDEFREWWAGSKVVDYSAI